MARKRRFHSSDFNLWVCAMGESWAAAENLIGIGVANTAEEARVGQRALEGAILNRKRLAKAFFIDREDVDASGIHRTQVFFSAKKIERGAALGAGLSENQGAVGKIEGGEVVAAFQAHSGRLPVQAPGDHEMEDEPEIAIEAEYDAFADVAENQHGLPFCRGDGRIGSAQEKRAGDADVVERLLEHAWFEGGEVSGDVGEFRHAVQDNADAEVATCLRARRS